MTVVRCAVEGDLDEIVARRLLSHVGGECGTVYGKQGRDHLRVNIDGYAAAAAHSPWFVLTDLDRNACPVELVRDWVENAPASLCFRVAVREIEAWFLADQLKLSQFLSVSAARLPLDPDGLDDPKERLVTVARRSRTRRLREGIPPREGSGRAIGPLYVTELGNFVRDKWDIDAAQERSQSLRRCVASLREMVSFS